MHQPPPDLMVAAALPAGGPDLLGRVEALGSSLLWLFSVAALLAEAGLVIALCVVIPAAVIGHRISPPEPIRVAQCIEIDTADAKNK